jgi:nucleoid-associated protein YgaU
MALSKAVSGLSTRSTVACAALLVAWGLASAPAAAQNFPITPQQRSTAEVVAASGIPLSELSPNAPDSYTVKPGDTLWAISGMFLKTPWRWPELWGMNMEQVRNPHRIYPGQTLYLEMADGLARLRMGFSVRRVRCRAAP